MDKQTTAWLLEWRAMDYNTQWWGFEFQPRRRGDWCNDINKAIRFSRKEDAERMRLHVIAVADMTGHHLYERHIKVVSMVFTDEEVTEGQEA